MGAEPKVSITSPKDGSQINQDKHMVLVTGKVSTCGGFILIFYPYPYNHDNQRL